MARGTDGLTTDAAEGADTLTGLGWREGQSRDESADGVATVLSLDDATRSNYTQPNNRRFRGHLPPIAATLNKVLKRDAPGGSPVRAILLSLGA